MVQGKFNRPQLKPGRFGIFDIFVFCLVAAFVVWLFYHIMYVYAYNWQWSIIPQYLAHQDKDGAWVLGLMGQGLIMTLRLSVWAVLGGVFWGLFLALSRLSSIYYLKLLARTLIELARNTPPLVLVFILYYFLSDQLIPWDFILSVFQEAPSFLSAFVAFLIAPVDELSIFLPAALTLAVYEGAYFAEIFRGSIVSIEKGQWEASWCLGLKKFQQYRYIIMPQVLKKAAPQLAGQFIATVKESAIVSVISIGELTYSGSQMAASLQQPFEVWLTVAALYFLICFSLSRLFHRLEPK